MHTRCPVGKVAGISLADMKRLILTMKELPDKVPPFPLPGVEEFKHLMPAATMCVWSLDTRLSRSKLTLNACSSLPKVSTSSTGVDDDEDDIATGVSPCPLTFYTPCQPHGHLGDAIGGNLKPRMHYPGQTNVTIRIEKIQLKDPSSYFEPFFTVSVKGVQLLYRAITASRWSWDLVIGFLA